MPHADRFPDETTRAKTDNPLRADDTVHVTDAPPRVRVAIERLAGVAAPRDVVHEGEEMRIGSHPSNDLVLDDPTISRFHCRLVRQGHAWHVVDAGSRNGTSVEGLKVLRAELDREVQVTLGDSVLRVRPDGTGAPRSLPGVPRFGALVGASPAMQRLYDMLARVAATDIDVLLQGESGTGKEVIATEIVQRSARAEAPIVVVDCGAIASSLVESELFGHVRGAFTGADRDREGAFEAADGGTVFLDEIGELPLALQPKLLRALEAREVRRVGATKAGRIDVRVIAATHRDLEREVNQGRFREDLYYRLAKVSLRVPALRERLEDVPLLVQSFLRAMQRERELERLFSPPVLADMVTHEWPGNVRELRNFVERSLVLDTVSSAAGGDEARLDRPETGLQPLTVVDRAVPFRVAKERAIDAFERAYLGPVFDECQGNVSKAARVARMDRMYLVQLAQKHGFRTNKKADGA